MRTACALIGLFLATSALAQKPKDLEFGTLFGSWVTPVEPGLVEEEAKGSREPRDWAPWWLADRQPQQFGYWYVWQGAGQLDPQVGHVILTRARWSNEDRFGPFFGFRVFEGQRTIALIAGTIPLNPKSPRCIWRGVSYAVDGGQARDLVDPTGGNCERLSLSGQVVQRLRAGNEAFIRIQGIDMRVSLNGFSAALDAVENR